MYSMTQFLKSNARNIPNGVASVMADRRRTWTQTVDRVSRLAAGMQRLGVQPGARVAILALNSDRYFEFLFAVWWAGAVVVPMNTRWSSAENVYALNNSESSMLFVDKAYVDQIDAFRAEVEELREVVYLEDGAAPEGMHSYEDLIAENDPAPDAERCDEDLAGLYYTGGTTGFPKGVMVPQRALWFNSVVLATAIEINSRSSYLHSAPMFHMADGAFSGGITAAGGAHYFVPSFEPNAVQETAAAYGVTHVLLVPTMWNFLLANPNFDAAKLASVRYGGYGASPMPEGLLKNVMASLPDLNLVQAYGQTELAPLATALTAEYHTLEGPLAGKIRSAGSPMTGIEVRIVGPDGEDMPTGEVGEVWARSPGTMLGYWKQPEATAATLTADGWVKTGDAAYMDEDGFVFIADRVKDMIVTGGENVFSAEVENAISTHPDVLAVAVIGVPSDQWGEAVHAIVIPKPGTSPTEEAIIEHTKPLIANYKRPRSVEFRTEAFSISGAGKVLKRDLRKPYWEGRERNVN